MPNSNLPELCPTCSAEVRSINLGMKHVNGDRPEEATFVCGCHMRYVPNFKGHPSAVEVVHHCPKSNQIIHAKAMLAITVPVRFPKETDRSVVEGVAMKLRALLMGTSDVRGVWFDDHGKVIEAKIVEASE